MLQGNLVAITAQQVLVMFLLILAGYLAVLARVLDAGARQGFSSLLVNLVVPAMIVDSYLIPFDPEILANLVRTAPAMSGGRGWPAPVETGTSSAWQGPPRLSTHTRAVTPAAAGASSRRTGASSTRL